MHGWAKGQNQSLEEHWVGLGRPHVINTDAAHDQLHQQLYGTCVKDGLIWLENGGAESEKVVDKFGILLESLQVENGVRFLNEEVEGFLEECGELRVFAEVSKAVFQGVNEGAICTFLISLCNMLQKVVQVGSET